MQMAGLGWALTEWALLGVTMGVAVSSGMETLRHTAQRLPYSRGPPTFPGPGSFSDLSADRAVHSRGQQPVLGVEQVQVQMRHRQLHHGSVRNT